MTSQIEAFPKELIYKFCSELDTKDLNSLKRTCRRFYLLLGHDDLYLYFPRVGRYGLEFIQQYFSRITLEHILNLDPKRVKRLDIENIPNNTLNKNFLLTAKFLLSLCAHQEVIERLCEENIDFESSDQNPLPFDLPFHNKYAMTPLAPLMTATHQLHHLFIWSSRLYYSLYKLFLNSNLRQNKEYLNDHLNANFPNPFNTRNIDHFDIYIENLLGILYTDFFNLLAYNPAAVQNTFEHFFRHNPPNIIINFEGFMNEQDYLSDWLSNCEGIFPNEIFLGICHSLQSQNEPISILYIQVNEVQLNMLCDTLKGKKICRLRFRISPDVTEKTIDRFIDTLDSLTFVLDARSKALGWGSPELTLIYDDNLFLLKINEKLKHVKTLRIKKSQIIENALENKIYPS